MSGPKPVQAQAVTAPAVSVLPQAKPSKIVPLDTAKLKNEQKLLEQPKQYWNDAKATQTMWLVAGAVAALAAVVIAGLLMAHALPLLPAIILGIDVLPLLVIGAVAAFFQANQIRDYLDPQQLLVYQAEASKMSFTEIVKKHSLKTALQFKVVTKEQMIEKFTNETKGKHFLEISRQYNLRELEAFGILNKTHAEKLSNLNLRYGKQYANYCQEIETALRNHAGISDQLRGHIHSLYLNPQALAFEASTGRGTGYHAGSFVRGRVVDTQSVVADSGCAKAVDEAHYKFITNTAPLFKEYVSFRTYSQPRALATA